MTLIVSTNCREITFLSRCISRLRSAARCISALKVDESSLSWQVLAAALFRSCITSRGKHSVCVLENSLEEASHAHRNRFAIARADSWSAVRVVRRVKRRNYSILFHLRESRYNETRRSRRVNIDGRLILLSSRIQVDFSIINLHRDPRISRWELYDGTLGINKPFFHKNRRWISVFKLHYRKQKYDVVHKYILYICLYIYFLFLFYFYFIYMSLYIFFLFVLFYFYFYYIEYLISII